jgi:hypothetical protein
VILADIHGSIIVVNNTTSAEAIVRMVSIFDFITLLMNPVKDVTISISLLKYRKPKKVALLRAD